MKTRNLNRDESKSLNAHYWAFVKLVSEDDSLLSTEGLLLKNLVINSGKYHSMSNIAREMSIQKPTICRICAEMAKKKYIEFVIAGNRKEVVFNRKLLKAGEKLVETILK